VTTPYWNPKNETMDRPELEALQLVKLRRLAAWSYERSPFHRETFTAAGLDIDQIRSLDDLRRIPLTTKEEWLANQREHPPFGTHLTAPPALAQRLHQTSGTTGRTPLRVVDGAKDWNWGAEMWAYGFHAAGIRRDDIFYICFGYGTFIGFWGAHYGAEKLGALVIASGGQTSEGRIRQLLDVGATTVCVTPTYALRLAEVARSMGADLAASPVKRLILSGEPGGSLPATRRLISEAWGAEVMDTAGMSEIGTICLFECDHHPGGMHIIEDNFIEEVVDPETGEPVGYGEEGERVVTSFGRGFMPLIRYKTGDLVRRLPYTACTCGRTFDIYHGGIIGRVDDMKLIRGINVYPSSVEAIVREFPEVDEFQIYIARERGVYDEISVRCELKAGHEATWPALQARLDAALADGHGGLRFNVVQAPAGTLPRFELKARRLVDQREV
jgi:phenylacetate-CoA ligase